MTWWCSATGAAWTWEWKAYPGVWLFIALMITGYLRLVRRLAPGAARGSQTVWFGLGILSLWAALDWPLGALGAGYLASVHSVSYILLSLIAPPLLLLALPRTTLLRMVERPPVGPLLGLLARPVVALGAYSAILVITHLPDTVDGLMREQWGAMLIDLAWLAGGLILWWPVLVPEGGARALSRPKKMLYLFVATLPPIVPFAFLTFSEYPLYAVYELAPRAVRLSAHDDQQLAGLTMKIIGDLPVWFAFGLIFFRWAKEDDARLPEHPGVAVQTGKS